MVNKKTILIALFACIGSLVFLGGFILSSIIRRMDGAWESIIFLYFFSFLSFFYFFSDIRTIKRFLVYCVAIPLLGCALSSTTDVIVTFFGEKFPVKGISDFIFMIMLISGGAVYFFYGWFVSISLLPVCGFYLWLQKSSNQHSKKLPLLYFPLFRNNLINLKWFKCNRFVFIVGFVYIVFMIFYFILFKSQWERSREVFSGATSVCLLSLFSILYLIPVVSNKMGKLSASFILFFCCVLFPLFWSVLVRSIYGALIYIYLYNTRFSKFFRPEILSPDFYFYRYIETRAWFISFLLILICGIYYYFAKLELVKNRQENILEP